MSELKESLRISSVASFDEELSELTDSIEQVLKENNACAANEQKDCVVIHVCDDNRDLEKNFECDRQLLLDKMTYFGQYLKQDPQQKEMDVDISVHCDILVFEWLMQYIQCEQPPLLDVQNVVSILISSHFLQMKDLVAECVDFLYTHLKEVIPLPLDLSCLHDDIVCLLAQRLSVADIDALSDDSDKIASRLFRFHCERFLEHKEHKLFYCVYCKQLFTKEQHSKMECRKAPIFIDFHGRIRRKHCAQRGWYVNKYLLGLRLQRFSWTAIYWHLWALTQSPLFCSACNAYVTLPNLYNCAYHKQQSTTTPNALNALYFACCQTSEQQFTITGNAIKRGCLHKAHTIAAEYTDLVETVAAHSQFVVIPFECSESSSVAVTFMDHCRSTAAENSHRSRTLTKHHHHHHHHPHHRALLHGHGSSNKRWASKTITTALLKTGVWDPKYFIFGSQNPIKSNIFHNHHDEDATDFDVYHERHTFWFDDCDESGSQPTTADNSFEYLSDLMALDQIDFGECDAENDVTELDPECDDEDAVLSDHDSVTSGDMHDFNLFFHDHTTAVTNPPPQPLQQEEAEHVAAASGKTGKNLPILGRRIQPMNSSDPNNNGNVKLTMDVKSTKRGGRSCSTFNMQQNDIQRLHKLMHSLHENRKDTHT